MNITPYEKGLEQGLERGIEQGLERGIEQGLERGIEQGLQRGIEQGRRDSLRELLEERFGPLSPSVLAAVERLPAERLLPLHRAAARAKSLADLDLAGED